MPYETVADRRLVYLLLCWYGAAMVQVVLLVYFRQIRLCIIPDDKPGTSNLHTKTSKPGELHQHHLGFSIIGRHGH